LSFVDSRLPITYDYSTTTHFYSGTLSESLLLRYLAPHIPIYPLPNDEMKSDTLSFIGHMSQILLKILRTA